MRSLARGEGALELPAKENGTAQSGTVPAGSKRVLLLLYLKFLRKKPTFKENTPIVNDFDLLT